MGRDDNGGWAFPRTTSGSAGPARCSGYFDLDFETSGGMTLRDYFAAQALLACWGNEHNRSRALDDARNAGHNLYQQLAIEAYSVADAMLAQRKVAEAPPVPTPQA